MTLTLSTVLQNVYRDLGELNIALATGGSTTTVADSTQINLGTDDQWKDGAVFVIRDAGGASAAPEGEFNRVSAYVNSSGTITVDTAFTAAAASGDLYGVVSQFYPLREMIAAVNRALMALGDIDLVDTTTLDTAASTTEYAAAVAWKRARPYRVDIQGLTGVTSSNDWTPSYDWEWVPATAGTTGKIIFSTYQVASRDIRVWYKDRHPVVNAYSAVISETIDPNLFCKAAHVEALRWQNARNQGSDKFLLQSFNDARQDLENLKVANPVQHPKRKNKLFIIGANEEKDRFTYPGP